VPTSVTLQTPSFVRSWHPTSKRQPFVPQPVEQTLVLIKPDAMKRGLAGVILDRFLRCCLTLVDIRLCQPDQDILRQLYQEHQEKPFYHAMIKSLTAGPTLAMVLEGEEAVPTVRKLIGGTNTLKAPPGTIRGYFALGTRHNLVHASETSADAKREIPLFFPNLPAR
jgi:nucleoside-diphosphate kinase